MRRSHLAFGLAAAVALSTAAVPVGAAPNQPQVKADGLTTKVTLITGDTVVVSDGHVQIRRAQGREQMAFRSFTDTRGDLHVVPQDAQEQLNSGRLDERLFDVSLLARSGYDDAARPTIPLIVQGGISAANATALPSINGRAVTAAKDGGFWTGVRAASDAKVWLDGKVSASLDRSAAQIGAPEAWGKGFTGAGVTVAVLDTGIDTTHPDLAGSVVEEKNFTDTASTDDKVGHGTHVAATVTGDGRYKGIAPDAKLVNGKVLDDFGGGYESGIIAGMEWAATKAKIVNMSLGSSWPSEGDDPMSQALNRISAQTGALFVVSAGNSGGAPGSPAAADAALTVGAVDRDDKLADFSSRGPRWVNNAIKPDITAPGVGIVAAKAKNGFIGTPVGDAHVALDGTSMASPHVAGAAAIIAAKNPAFTGQDVKAALMNAAKPNPALTVFEQGAGRVDVAKAVSAAVTAAPGSISFGTAQWPHGDDQPLTQKVSYRNTGTAPVTLDLKIDEQKPGAGVFSVSPAKLTIPAGGTAEATVTADTRVNVPDALYAAAVVASDGTRTPIAVDKEVESYNITLKFVDHAGLPTANYFYRFVDVNNPRAYVRHDPSGTVTGRLPKGTFFLDATVSTRDPDPMKRGRTTIITEPAFEVTGDATVTLDGREATQPAITVPQAEARMANGELRFDMRANWGPTGGTWYVNAFDGILLRPSKTTWPKFEWYAQSVMAKPAADGTFAGSPYQYHVRISEKGKVPANVQRSVRDADLAKVDSVTHARVPGSIGQRDDGASGPLPLRLKEFYTPDVPWHGSLTEFEKLGQWPSLGSQYQVVARSFKLGRTHTEHWNSAVFGPAFPSDPNPEIVRSAGRVGNQLRLEVPMFADSSGRRVAFTPATGKTTLSSNGKVLSESNYPGEARAVVAPEKATYQLHAEGVRAGQSSSVTGDWTFTSAHVAGDLYKSVPLLAVRFAPKVDELNRAQAGRPLTVPVTVQRNGTTGNVTNVKTPEVQVSYDEGKTWKQVRLVRAGGQWLTTLWHPKDAKSVSFKAKTSDTGGSVEQTILRAYELR